MSGFVYVWRDRSKNMFYIGSHWGPEDDGYVCSSVWMRKAHKNRPGDFRRRIVSRVSTSRLDLRLEEQRWLNMIRDDEMKPRARHPRYYNLMKRTTGWWYDDDMIRTIGQKISEAKTGIPSTMSHEEQIARGQKISETKQKKRRARFEHVDLEIVKQRSLGGETLKEIASDLKMKTSALRGLLVESRFYASSERARLNRERRREEKNRRDEEMRVRDHEAAEAEERRRAAWTYQQRRASEMNIGRKHDETTREKLRAAHAEAVPLTCPHCGKTGGRIMLRWHFDKCKQKSH